MRRRNQHTINGNAENSIESSNNSAAVNPSSDSKAAEEILKSANEAAGTVRNLFVSYILLAVYILITVGSTNDEQLLRDSGVAVPFLSNITLPVSYFYKFVPWLFGFFHFELLLHFKLLADKLHAFNRELEPLPASTQKDLRQSLASFPFSHWLAGEHNDAPMQFVTGLVVWITLFPLALFTLLALQIGFLPYHSDWTTLSNRLALLGDAAALGFFWPKLVESNHSNPLIWWRERLQAWPLAVKAGIWWLFVACFAWECWNWFFDGDYLLPFEESNQVKLNIVRYCLLFVPLTLWWLFRAWGWAKRRLWTKWMGAVLLAFLFLLLAGILISGLVRCPEILLQRLVAFYGELLFIVRWPKFVAEDVENGWLGSVGYYPPFSWLVRIIRRMRQARVHGDPMSTSSTGLTAKGPFANPAIVALLFAAYISLFVATLPDTDLKKCHPLTCFLFEDEFFEDEVSWLHRNLHLPEKLLVANSPELETLSELEYFDSNDAKTIDAALVKVAGLDLRRRDLRHAELSLTKLYKVDLRQAKIQGASLLGGHLQNAKLDRAWLQGAILRGAELQGADLSEAKLQGADLIRARLQGANLSNTELQGADLRRAQLQGADLSGAWLQGADLKGAELQGANLSDAELQGADLRRAQLQGADLSGAKLQGADLSRALLQGANFNSAYIGSALLAQAESGFNDFRKADFNKLFTQEDYNDIAKILGIKRDDIFFDLSIRVGNKQNQYLVGNWNDYMGLLHQRIGQATKLPQPGFEPPCLADTNIPAVKNCGKAVEYFPKLVEFIDNLACKPAEAKSQHFIATGISKRVVGVWVYEDEDDVEWKSGGDSARQKIAQRLLADDCAGNEGIYLDAKTREELKKIAEPPNPVPGEP